MIEARRGRAHQLAILLLAEDANDTQRERQATADLIQAQVEMAAARQRFGLFLGQ